MGIFDNLKKGWKEGRSEHKFNVNSNKISQNLFLLEKGKISYGKFLSNTSYLLSEQINYQYLLDMTDYQLNRASIKIGFLLTVFCYGSKNFLLDVDQVENFESFYWDIRDDFLNDFFENNPTVENKAHLETLLDKSFGHYTTKPFHFDEKNEYVQSTEVIRLDISREVTDFYLNDFGVDLYKKGIIDFDRTFGMLCEHIKKSVSQRED